MLTRACRAHGEVGEWEESREGGQVRRPQAGSFQGAMGRSREPSARGSQCLPRTSLRRTEASFLGRERWVQGYSSVTQ